MTARTLPCAHGMPNAATCVDCMEDGPVEPPARWERVGDPFVARYDGACIGCDATTIVAGSHRVQRWDRGDRTAYLHERCTP